MSLFNLIWDLDQEEKIAKLIHKVEEQESRIEVLEGWIKYLDQKIEPPNK